MNDIEVYDLFRRIIYKSKIIKWQDKNDAVSILYLRYRERGLEFENWQKCAAYVYKSLMGLNKIINRDYYLNGFGIDIDRIRADKNLLVSIFERIEADYRAILEAILVDKYTYRELRKKKVYWDDVQEAFAEARRIIIGVNL